MSSRHLVVDFKEYFFKGFRDIDLGFSKATIFQDFSASKSRFFLEYFIKDMKAFRSYFSTSHFQGN